MILTSSLIRSIQIPSKCIAIPLSSSRGLREKKNITTAKLFRLFKKKFNFYVVLYMLKNTKLIIPINNKILQFKLQSQIRRRIELKIDCAITATIHRQKKHHILSPRAGDVIVSHGNGR